MDKLNILVLYQMGDPKYWRKAVRDLEFMLPDYAPDHNYIVHDGAMRLPEFVKEIEFHGIVLGPTFLCNRYRRKSLMRVLREYDFIRVSNAFKIAMPQDDYDCSGILDRWMVGWRIDVVYSVCPNNWDVLYPSYLQKGRIRLGYTGYVSGQLLDSLKNPKPFASRGIDISYRASILPPNFGRIGHIKGTIGDLFKRKINGLGLKLDISTDGRDLIPGEKWHEFVEDSKFCLATNSGSSLLDPEGEIRDKVTKYLIRFPHATFDEVEKNCFPGEDGKYVFTAISPRHIEAALAKTVQLATPGSYNGIFEAEKHYVSLEPDCSNINDVIKMMNDLKKVAAIAEDCKEAILSIKALRFKNHVHELIDQIADGVTGKRIKGTSEEAMQVYIKRYQNKVANKTNAFWMRRRLINKMKTLAILLGAGKLKHIVTGVK